MSKLIGKLLVCLACLTLFHDLSILKALSRPESGVPSSIVIEAFVSLICFIVGIVYITGELKDVTYRGELAHRTIDDSDARMGFMRLSKRGKAIFGDLDR
ncbi:hypothetical protein I305_01838 [Cryptococcus gattii E566]|uniref:Membrane magnesium transporter n=2 Tax=Cryptococcus gattii TaxID=37769 RepID=E6R409_CRYGW|nr:Hypothetical protein CGB_D4820C [Cryptococcus gattii WM276]ADV21788.1 Hypothetical protein CGB_D4820C [Cryptococcus gattii WM276]KIR80731.1 hypothetical protein I306_02186 [Cryptococcus gattii EJB2]KIY35589.1 hypothetical protein I305_01838 [Cryptococcus gattii E566]KJE04437.1 hypothetical protein I311_01919 [Cryptococcus gattii NT-10]